MSLPTAYLDEFDEPAGYLEFASTGPVSRRVRSTMDEVLAAVAVPRGSVTDSLKDRYRRAVAAMASLVGVPGERATPIPSTSAGLFQAAFGLIPAGGNVVVAAHEFPANLYPWHRAAALGGPQVRLLDVPDRRLTPERVAEAVDSGTVAVSVSLVDFAGGFRVDIAGLRAAAGDALLVIDAIQGLGAVRAELGPADVLVAGGQKWLRSGWGSGVMAVSERALERLSPTLTGWYAVEGFLDFDEPLPHEPRAGAERFQEGSPAMLGAFCLEAAVAVIDLAGIDTIEAAVLQRATEVEEAVRAAGAEVLSPWRDESERAGILCFRMPGEDPETTRSRLAEAGVIVSRRSRWLRAAPHASTRSQGVDLLREALEHPR